MNGGRICNAQQCLFHSGWRTVWTLHNVSVSLGYLQCLPQLYGVDGRGSRGPQLSSGLVGVDSTASLEDDTVTHLTIDTERTRSRST